MKTLTFNSVGNLATTVSPIKFVKKIDIDIFAFIIKTNHNSK